MANPSANNLRRRKAALLFLGFVCLGLSILFSYWFPDIGTSSEPTTSTENTTPNSQHSNKKPESDSDSATTTTPTSLPPDTNLPIKTGAFMIGSIQGNGDKSPLEGKTVTIEGIVTADFRSSLGGFFIQDTGDGDSETSDGLFIINESVKKTFDVGEYVEITGQVVELARSNRPGTLTSIQADDIRLLAKKPNAPLQPIKITSTPNTLEVFEGMWVQLNMPLTILGIDGLASRGELDTSMGGRLWHPNEVAIAGSPEAKDIQKNNERQNLTIDDGSKKRNPPLWHLPNASEPRLGSQVTYAEGILDERDGGYRLQPLKPLKMEYNVNPNVPEVAGSLRVASFNLENFFNGDGKGAGFPTERGAKTPEQFKAQLAKLVSAINTMQPDVAALMELENDGFDANSSIAQLVATLNSVPKSPNDWQFIDAGKGPGSQDIRVGIIFRSSRVQALGEPVLLSGAPFNQSSRTPIAQAFVGESGTPWVIAAIHLKSKSCANAKDNNADQNDGQGCWSPKRLDATTRLNKWLSSDPTGNNSKHILMVGDFNAYAQEESLLYLYKNNWIDSLSALKNTNAERPYSYVYKGLSGRLDHALITTNFANKLRGAAIWHINADHPEKAGYSEQNHSGPWRSSDHDPLLLGFDL